MSSLRKMVRAAARKLRSRWNCDFCDVHIPDVRVKLTHKSGMVFISCVGCSERALRVGPPTGAMQGA